MSSRIGQLALYWIGLSLLAWTVGLPHTLSLLTALSALAALAIRHPGVRYGAEGVLVVVAALGALRPRNYHGQAHRNRDRITEDRDTAALGGFARVLTKKGS